MRRIFIFLPIAVLACCNSAEPLINYGPEKFYLLSGFENRIELSDNYPELFESGILKQSGYYAAEGMKSLQINSDSEKDIVLSEAVGRRINISYIYSAVIDVLNVSDNYAEISVYIQFADSGEVFGAGTIRCPPGDSRNLRTDLSVKLPEMTEAGFLSENDRIILEKGDLSLYIDNFRLSGHPEMIGKSVSFPLYPDLSGFEKDTLEITAVDIAEIPEGLYEKAEIDVFLDAWIENPYDPGQITVDALLTDPAGNQKTMPGFYYVPFSRNTTIQSERLAPSGEGFFKVRFSPDIPGSWKIIIRAVTESGEAFSKETEINVPDIQNKKGNIEVSSGPRYFGYTNGDIYFPIGLNVSWYDRRGMVAYEKWFRPAILLRFSSQKNQI